MDFLSNKEDGSTRAYAVDNDTPQAPVKRLVEQGRLLTLALKSAHMIAWRHDLTTGMISELVIDPSTSDAAPPPFSFDHLMQRMHPDDRQIVRDAVSRALKLGRLQEVEYRMPVADGAVRWARACLEPYCDDDGKPEGLIGVVHDVTEQKLVDARLARAASERDEARTRQQIFFRDVLRSVTDGRLILCGSAEDLPKPLARSGKWVVLSASVGLQEIRERARNACKALAYSNERRQDLLTAVGEAAMNAIVHAGGGRGRICWSAGTIQAWIYDTGRGIDVSNLPRATLEKGYTTAGTFGHGMKLILQTADRVYLLTGSTGTTVVVEQDRIAARPRWA